MDIKELENYASFGIAGNFTGHLEQAGELKDFLKVKTAEENAPKAIFPTYISNASESKTIPQFLGIFPFDDEKIIFPSDEKNIQLEPECAVVFNVRYENKQIIELIPESFTASNDCSIRKEGAKKISLKKNWGKSSKGVSNNFIKIDKFCEGGNINDYRIASYLMRDDQIISYGENSAIKDYNYIYDKLNNWIIDRFNNQKDEGPAEYINSYICDSGLPKKILISIGATRYTDFGKNNYLLPDDYSIVVLYPESKYTENEIKDFIKDRDFSKKDISFLVQKIVLEKPDLK